MSKKTDFFSKLDEDLASDFGQVANESPQQFTNRVMGDLQSFIKEVEKDQLPGETLADTIKRVNNQS